MDSVLNKKMCFLSVTLIVSSCLVQQILCAKFAAFLAQTKSHIFPVLAIAKELEKYNHTVVFVLSTTMYEDLHTNGTEISHIQADSLDKSSVLNDIRLIFESKWNGSKSTFLLQILPICYQLCHDFMTDDKLYTTLENERFDYAIVDYAPFLCFEIMAYKLSLPFIFVGAHFEPIASRVPFNPSFMPTFWSGFSDRMTFRQRIVNSFLFFVHLSKPSMPSFGNIVHKYAPEKPDLTNHELTNSALLHIIDGDVLFDYPMPIPPNMVFCGGLAASPAKPLPSGLENFMQHSKTGVVLVSFGSNIKSLPENLLNKMLSAFKRVNDFNYIIRHGNEEKQSGNVLLSPWLPQNDIIGHPKTKLLITHCGKSSVLEALYHGVPMIGFPMVLDQETNAAIMHDKGYGLVMDTSDFTVEDLVDNIIKVALTGHYTDNIKKASEIFHSRPQTPAQRAAYWINLVTMYGTKHFRPFSLDMPWYSYYMIDLLLFYLLALCFVFFICKLFVGRCRRKDKKMKAE